MLPSEFTPLIISPESTDVEERGEEERTSPFTSSVPDVATIGGGVSPDWSLLRRSPGHGHSGSSRRVSSEPSIYSTQRRPMSFRGDVTHAVSETYLVTRLALTLLRYLGIGYRWIIKFLALACYTLLLLPGFLQGDERNRLDLYLPVCADGSKPIVAFVTGGAWIIGYKAWGALLGRRLAERGIIVACIDYRNFSQGTISHMVEDASRGISFVCKNAVSFGGDPNRIYLIGQSAGAHIAACTLIEQALKECGEGESTSWSLSQIKAYFGISGGYNLLNLVNHFHSRGLYRSIFLSIMEGEQSLRKFSPEAIVQDSNVRHAVSLLPHIILYHGTNDCSIPSSASKEFSDSLHRAGAKSDLVLYEGKTHTDLFLQDPLRGGKDDLLDDIVLRIHDTSANDDHDVAAHLRQLLVPECMLQLARKISPF